MRRTGGSDRFFDLLADGLERDAQRFERLGGDAFTLVDEAEEDVLSADEVVVQETRFLLRQHKHSASPVGKPFEQLMPLYLPACLAARRRRDQLSPGWCQFGTHPRCTAVCHLIGRLA